LPVAALDSWRYTRYWLDATRGQQEDVIKTIGNLDGYQRAAKQMAALVPANECVFTPQVNLMLWHARRVSFLPPRAAFIWDDAQLACHWFHAVGEASGGNPAFYPLETRPDLKLVAAWTAAGQPVADGQTQATNLLLRLP
jgi:hypothetical protein